MGLIVYRQPVNELQDTFENQTGRIKYTNLLLERVVYGAFIIVLGLQILSINTNQ